MNSYNLTLKSLNFTKGFKDFIARGNVINLAIAVVIGQLFSKIVSSLVADIIMPPVSLLFNCTDSLKNLRWEIKSNIYINYGNFLQTIFEFLILSFVIYTILALVLKNQLKAKPKVEIKDNFVSILEHLNKEIVLLSEIKHILKKNSGTKY